MLLRTGRNGLGLFTKGRKAEGRKILVEFIYIHVLQESFNYGHKKDMPWGLVAENNVRRHLNAKHKTFRILQVC